MPTIARIIDMFRTAPTPRAHDDVTPMAVLMR